MTQRQILAATSVGHPLSLTEHITRTVRLAVPVMASRAGMIVMISVDTAMCGYAGEAQLAYYGIALAPMVFLLVLGIGSLTGTVVLVAQADGAERQQECGPVWRAALLLAAGVGTVGAAILFLGQDLLLFFGQSPQIAEGGSTAMIIGGLGLPGVLLYIASTFFLEGIGRVRPGMAITLVANLMNFALNWALIEGNMGAPEMGAAGAMLATTVTRWTMFLAILLYILHMRDGHHYGIRGQSTKQQATISKLVRIGLPLSLAISCESGTFTAATFFAGEIGETALAAYQAAHNVTTFVFMLAIGLGTATAVRVANAVGRLDLVGVSRAGWVGLGLVTAMMVLIGGLIGVFDQRVARIYSNEALVLEIMVAGLSVIAFLVVVDGIQAVLISALRGAGDVLVPTAIYILSFPVVAVPTSRFLGLSLGWGVPGLLWGLALGLACAGGLLAWRFRLISGREIRTL